MRNFKNLNSKNVCLKGVNKTKMNFFRITNLKFWGEHEKLLSATLNLLGDLTIGFANVIHLNLKFIVLDF